MFKSLNKKAQSINEFAIFLGVVVAALVLMQPFIRRALQAHYKDLADNFKDYELAGKQDSEYSKDLGSVSDVSAGAKENDSMTKEHGVQVVKKRAGENQSITANQLSETYGEPGDEWPLPKKPPKKSPKPH